MNRLLLIFIFSICGNYVYSQPEELFRGRHIVKGGIYGHPYTTFDRQNGDLGINQTVKRIRERIISEDSLGGPVVSAYRTLYNFAIGPMPTDGD
jgi:hypothetical protein